MNASTSISTRIHGSMRARASIIEVAGRVSPKASSELLQRGERVLSTARTKGNFAYKGISVTAVDSCQNGWGVETPIPRRLPEALPEPAGNARQSRASSLS